MEDFSNFADIPSLQFCDHCGIRQENGTFYWSNPSKNMVAPADAVYTRICRYAKNREKCLNQAGKVDDQYRYESEERL